MTYKVTYTSPYNYSIKTTGNNDYKVSLQYAVDMAKNLNDLENVQISGNLDKYVLMYDASIGKWINVNPDDVLSAATTEPISPGLPSDFENQLDVDLDNRIDLDAGNF